MKSIVSFFFLGLLTAGLVVQNHSTQIIDSIQADIDINSVTPRIFLQLKQANPQTTKIEFIEELKIAPIGSTVGDFRFDREGNIFFTSTDPAMANPKDLGVSIVKFDRKKKEQKVVPMEEVLKEEQGKEIAWQCYDVDDFGNIYIGISHRTLAAPRHIFVLNVEGDVISRFNLPNFLPYSISVDDTGGIWIAGESFGAETTNSKGVRGQGQIRVYDKGGNLIAIPVGGFKPEDIASGSFVKADSRIKFFLQGENGIVYNFAGTELMDVWSYPLQQESTNASKHLFGLMFCNDYAIWHGAFLSEATQEPFIMLASSAGDRLTSENKLMIKSNRSFIPVGASKDGDIYFLSVERGKTILRTAKVYLDKHHPNKRNEQIHFVNYE